jgi:oligosaccharide repeat unit polymerase
VRTFISENRKYARIKIFLEIIAWLTLVVLGCLAVTLGLLSIRGASLLCVYLVLGLLVSAWWNFEGGRHPCFLFLGMLFIFQCGRLLGYMTGSPDEPFAVVGQFPFLVSRSSEEITLLLIVLSAICVYAPCRILYRRVVFRAGPEQDWLSGLYWLLLLTLPFAVYKNYLYLSYIRSHGGYIAVYTDTAVIQQSAGVLMRTGALVGTSVLLLLYLFERRAGFMTLLLSLFFIVSSMELLIGFRGKIFVQILVFWFIRNLKAGKKFNLIPLFSAAVVFSVVAVIVAGFREEHAINWLGPLGFVSGEGVSMGVTEMAVEERDMFAKNTGRYLLGGVKSIFGATDDIFAVDLSLYLDPDSFKAGYSLGSSYLADAYLLGGVVAVAGASLLLGTMLSWIYNHCGSWKGAVLMMASLGSIIYMPRGELFGPISGTAKSLLAFAAAAVMLVLMSGLYWLCLAICQDRPTLRNSPL